MIVVLILALMGALILFCIVGIIVLGRSVRRMDRRSAPQENRTFWESLRQRSRRYVGPVRPEMAILKPKMCVLLEFFTALCGFPGIGWLMSARVMAGLLLFSIVPSFVWAFFPVYVCVTGKLARNAFLPVMYLPVLALVSAGSLAAHQIISARRRDGKEQD